MDYPVFMFGAVLFLFLTYVVFTVLHRRLEVKEEIFQVTMGK